MSNKVKTIITTDGEIDDMNSLIHLCLYLNEIDLLGVIYTSSQYHFNGDGGKHTLGEVTPHYRTSGPAGLERPRTSHGPDPKAGELTQFRPFPMGWIEELWKGAYAKAYPNLIKHDASFPSPEYLCSITKVGNIEFEGDIRYDSEGSDMIKNILLDEDDEPIYLQSWGGVNTIVRALVSIYEQYHDKDNWNVIYDKVVKKTRILGVMKGVGQDNSYLDAKIPELYPDLILLHPEFFYGTYFAPINGQKDSLETYHAKWLCEHIHTGDNPLMDEYHLMGDGREIKGEADIYQFGLTGVLDFGFPGTKPYKAETYDFIGEGDSNTYMPLFDFGLRGNENYAYPGVLGRLFTNGEEPKKSYDYQKGEEGSVNPFERAYQDDWAARAKWCINDYEHANHAPIVHVCSDFVVEAGECVELDGVVRDPDGDQVTTIWEHYPNFDHYSGEAHDLRVFEPWKLHTYFTVPKDAVSGDYFILILRAIDDAELPMTSYGTVVVHVA